MPQVESEAERIFNAARVIGAHSERAGYVNGACGADAALRARVEALLSAHDQAGEFLTRPAHAAAITEQAGQMIGRYKLLEQLGEGGFGSVWMAEQREPVKRRVALKVIKLGMDTKQVIARFEAERQALAMMDHPNIAKVLDAGATDAGRPFFVMELVRGVPILEYCDTEKLDTAARLALFSSVCHAIQHAHQKGIIHRDIKPSNVLVTLHDGVAVVKVIDFGIAKATHGELTQKTLFTEHRQMIGTPAYMSPEQAEMSGLDIDTRADIYSLGVLLYELLTGTTPLDVKELLSKGFAEMMRAIREDEPHKPSTRISTLGDTAARTAQQRHVDVRKLGLLLRGDLDWIVMKCLEKDRSRRYETANGLAADIGRHLAGEVVIAAPPSTAYRLSKFVKRNKGAVGAGGAVAGALLIGVIAFAWQTNVARGERDNAVKSQTAEAAQRKIADAQRDRALAAEAETSNRADELKLVSDFQAGMLAQIDPTEAGVQLSADVRAKFEEALIKAHVPESERAVQIAAFNADWTPVNATDAARELIDRTILRPAVATIDKQFKDQPVVEAQLRQVLADRYQELGLYDAALPLQEQALATRRRVLGEEDQDTLSSINNMGSLLQAQGKLSEAEPYFREALGKCRRALGNENLTTLIVISNLGLLLQQQAKLSAAEPYFREALETLRRVFGEENLHTLISINNLGVLLQYQGKLNDAEPYLREALEKRRRVQGEEHPDTLISIGSVGELLRERGKLDQAEPYLREALEKSRRVRGEEHPNTLIWLGNLGALLQDQGKLSEAEPYVREALEKRRRVLGDEHQDTLCAINNLGELLQRQGKLSEAEPYLREALERCRRILGDENPTTLQAIAALGSLLLGEDKLSEAEPLLREALEKCRRVLGEEQMTTLVSVYNLGTLLMDQGKPAEAEPYFREELEKRRRVLGIDDPTTVSRINSLSNLLLAQGRAAEAEPLLRELLDHARSQLSADDPQLASSLAMLGLVLLQQRKFSEAEPLLRECLAIRAAKLPGTWFTYNAQSLLGGSLAGQGKHDEADPLLVGGFEKMELPAANAIRKREALQRLIEHYEAWGKAEDAARYKKLLEAQPVPAGGGK